MELRPSPVERQAKQFGIPVFTPKTLRTAEAQDVFRAHDADAAVVVAYGLILPRPVLDAPRLGCFNLHASALPRWRGAAPINRAIMAGDPETAVMVMKMEEGLDTGPVAMAERVAIDPDMTAGELHDTLARRGADLMVRALGALERGSLQLTPQPEAGVTYAAKIDKNETRIDWARPWKEVHDHCRGLSPFPGAWFELPGRRPHQGAAHHARRRQRRAGNGARRSPHHRLRRRRDPHRRAAARRREADEGGRVSARHRGRPRHPARVMPRYKLTIEYDGRPFVGWQVQDNGISVQGVLTAAVAAFCGETVHVQGAGRTDAGVHALGQVAHVDLTKAWEADTVRDALNACLRPHPVAVLAAEPAAESFDARFSAMKRHYLYRIVNRRADLALDVGRALRVPRPLDADAMHAAAQRLVGRHDFTTFRAAECQAKSPEKTLDKLDVERHGDELRVHASARSFLHHQVRSMVGSLILVGDGRWSADDLANALAARDRKACGPVAPPDGLYLVRVDY